MARVAVGLYFLVSGALYLPAALYALGVESVGPQRWVLWAVPLIQAAVSFAAGWYLVKARRGVQSAASPKSATFVVHVLQLLGVYLVVEGAATAARPVIDMLLFTEAWPVRAGTLASGAVQGAAGFVLLTRTRQVAAFIETRGAAA